MSICWDNSFQNCNDKKRKKNYAGAKRFFNAVLENMSKPISRDRSLSFRTQRLAFQPTQSQQTLKNGYITVNVSYSWTSSKLLICWDTMDPQVLKHSMRSFLLVTLEASTHRSEDHQFIKWISSL